MYIPTNPHQTMLGPWVRVLLVALSALLLCSCLDGGGSSKKAGQTQVTISVVEQQVALNDADAVQLAGIDHSTGAVSWLVNALVREAHAVPFSESFPFLGLVTLQIIGEGFTTASINSDFNEGRFPMVEGEDAIILTDSDVTLTVPDTVDLSFIVTAFNLDGFRIFRGENTLTVAQLNQASVALPIPLVVDIDERIPRLVAGTGCPDTDGDGICNDFEDVFVNQSGEPDIDGDGIPNSQDTNSDGDQLSDAAEGITPSNDGFPVFIHKNRSPTFVANVTIDIDGTDTGSVATPAVTDPDVGDTHAFSIATPPANGTAIVVNNQIVYTADGGFNGADSFQTLATDLGGLSTQGSASVSVTGNPVPPPQKTLVWDEGNWDDVNWE